MLFNKKLAYWIEKTGGLITGTIISFVILFLITPDINNLRLFVSSIPSVSICIFGFLLTMLSIILQGNSPTLEVFRSSKHKNTYNNFTHFSKRVVLLSFTITILSLLIKNTDIPTSLLSDYMVHLFNSMLTFVYLTTLI